MTKSSSLAVTSTVSALVLIGNLVMKTAGSMATLKMSSTTLPGAKYVSPAARAAERSVLLMNATGLSGDPGGMAIGILTSDMLSLHTEHDKRQLIQKNCLKELTYNSTDKHFQCYKIFIK